MSRKLVAANECSISGIGYKSSQRPKSQIDMGHIRTSFERKHTSTSMMVLQSGKVAFVTGANGISGHAIIEQLVKKDKTEWYVFYTSKYMPVC